MRTPLLSLAVAAAVLATAPSLLAQTLTVTNDGPRTDVNGDTVDVHDGRVIKFGDTYYWYGTAYENTTGFTRANEYRVYSSPDMMTWTPHGAILPDAASGIYYRPHVVYNARDREYVLWYNWYPKLWTGRFGVATSKSPLGPFRVVNDDVQVAHSSLGVGDFNVFVDEDATAYLMYNTIQGHQLSVERLAPGYKSSTMENGGFITKGAEAGSVFRRGGTYYLLTDYTCCFCTQGSGARVYTSDDPLRGYALRQNINRQPGTVAARLTDGDLRPTVHEVIFRSGDREARDRTDSFPAVQLDLPVAAAYPTLRIRQYTGNRRGQCGDTTLDYTHVPRLAPDLELSMRVGGAWTSYRPAPVRVERKTLHNDLHVDLRPLTGELARADALRFRVSATYPYPIIQLIEADFPLGGTQTVRPDAYVLDVDPMTSPPIIPAQQTFIMPLEVDGETEYLWMGDLWGSAPDNVKGHDVQYWSSPLEFYENGLIKPLRWEGSWGM